MKKITILSLIGFAFAIPSKKKSSYDAKFIESHFKYIPMSTFNFGSCMEDNIETDKLPCKVRSVYSYYIYDREVSNALYLQFVNESGLDKNLTLPDTTVWNMKQSFMQPYAEYYFRHPAYTEYPVVGISHAQCLLFCEWLSKKYNSIPKRKFKKVIFDLPAEEEWVCAAQGGLEYADFPWHGPMMQNTKGEWLANFMMMDQSSIYRKDCENDSYHYSVAKNSKYTHSGADVTAPVGSYWINDFGLYNMSGNVEEFVKEKGISKGGSWRDTGYYLRIQSREKYDDTNEKSVERGFRVVMRVN